mgnify:CR=1 FL=1
MFDPEDYVSSTDLSILFKLTSRRIQQLTADGILNAELDSTRKRRYKLGINVQNYVLYLSDKAYDREKRETDADKLVLKKLQAEVDLKEAKAAMAQLELAELEGRMHRSEDVEDMTADLCLNIRSNLLAMPGQLAKDVAEETDPSKIQIIIKETICLILEELSNYEYNREEYKRRASERKGWETDQDEEEQGNEEE